MCRINLNQNSIEFMTPIQCFSYMFNDVRFQNLPITLIGELPEFKIFHSLPEMENVNSKC